MSVAIVWTVTLKTKWITTQKEAKQLPEGGVEKGVFKLATDPVDFLLCALSSSQGWPGQQTVRTAHRVTHHPESRERIHEQRQPEEAAGALAARMDGHREELC